MFKTMAIRASFLVIIMAAIGVLAAWQSGMLAPQARQPDPAPQVGEDPPPTPITSGSSAAAVGPLASCTNEPVQLVYAVTPKELSGNVTKALAWLVAQQHANGGWGQGGGWRTAEKGGRVEGAQVQDPPDVGNTCVALLALIRAGNTPTEGEYKDHVAKGLAFICGKVEGADKDSLYVTDVRNTQLQSKIGPFVDTFLTTMVLAELKGKMGDENSERRLAAALDKTAAKIAKHQNADGHFAGNHGWASVLSQGLASKGIARAAQVGNVDAMRALRVEEQRAQQSFDQVAGGFKPAGAGDVGGFGGTGRAGATRDVVAAASRDAITTRITAATSAPSDAGVPIYNASANVAALQEAVNTNEAKKRSAQLILASPQAPPAQKQQAEADLRQIAQTEKVQEAAVKAVVLQAERPEFVAGFGNNGGEEFLSFMNISETLLARGGDDWSKWDQKMTEAINRAQDKDGSWSGHHCITGKTFCTSAALLVLMADRVKIPATAKKGK